MSLFPKRKLDRITAAMDTCITGRLIHIEFEAKFAEESMYPVVPVLLKFPFMSIHP